MEIIVKAQHVLVLSKFAADPKICDDLGGIRIEPAAPLPGAYLVALDGHKLGVIYDAQAEADQAITLKINPDLLKACKQPKKEGPRVVHVEDDKATVRYPFSDAPLYIQPGDASIPGTFPDWRMMTRYEPSDRPMSAELLPQADKLAAFALDGGFPSMRLYPTKPAGPIYVRVPAWPNFFGIVMPVAPFNDPDDDASLTAKPSWLPGVK